MDEILKLQPCLTNCPSSLPFSYDKLNVYVQGLSSLGVSSQEYGSLLIPIIMSKLLNAIRLEITRKSTNEVWKINELLDTIKREVKACEAREAIKTQEVHAQNHQTLVRILHNKFVQRMHYLRQKAKNYKSNAFIAMWSITQPPA